MGQITDQIINRTDIGKEIGLKNSDIMNAKK